MSAEGETASALPSEADDRVTVPLGDDATISKTVEIEETPEVASKTADKSTNTSTACLHEKYRKLVAMRVEFHKVYDKLHIESENMDRISKQLVDYYSVLFCEDEDDLDDAESAQLVGEIYHLDKERRKVDQRTDKLIEQSIELCSSMMKHHDLEDLTSLATQIKELDQKRREGVRKINRNMTQVNAQCRLRRDDFFSQEFEE